MLSFFFILHLQIHKYCTRTRTVFLIVQILFLNLAFFNIILIECLQAMTITIWWNFKLNHAPEKQSLCNNISLFVCISLSINKRILCRYKLF
jgi:uncharacterized membrane protein